jgi:hypothetical protein
MTEGSNNAGYSQLSTGPGIEVLAWKCPHTSVYCAIHSVEVEPSAATVDQAKAELLAYYQTTATCGCTPVIQAP